MLAGTGEGGVGTGRDVDPQVAEDYTDTSPVGVLVHRALYYTTPDTPQSRQSQVTAHGSRIVTNGVPSTSSVGPSRITGPPVDRTDPDNRLSILPDGR